MDTNTPSHMISWIFGVLFLVIGVLNLILVHPVPGAFYIVLSLFYVPQANSILKRKLGFSIPLSAKVVLALVVLWGTLAVTDLAQMCGF